MSGHLIAIVNVDCESMLCEARSELLGSLSYVSFVVVVVFLFCFVLFCFAFCASDETDDIVGVVCQCVSDVVLVGLCFVVH